MSSLLTLWDSAEYTDPSCCRDFFEAPSQIHLTSVLISISNWQRRHLDNIHSSLHSQCSQPWKPHPNLSVRLKAMRCTHGEWESEVWLRDWQVEDDQGSLIHHRLGLCTELHPRLWHTAVPPAVPGYPANAHQCTSVRPSHLFAQLLLQRYDHPSLTQHFKNSMTNAVILAFSGWNCWLKFTSFTHLCTVEFLLRD